nr:MAG TPA: hypothetical protein [Ackermannviridae sp.]
MAQYIDLEALVDWLKHIPLKDLSDGQGLCRVIMEDDFKSAISSLPESAVADMVPVVRCKDCRYSRPAGKNCEDMVVCTALSKDYLYMMKSDFCSYGTFKEATIGSDTD